MPKLSYDEGFVGSTTTVFFGSSSCNVCISYYTKKHTFPFVYTNYLFGDFYLESETQRKRDFFSKSLRKGSFNRLYCLYIQLIHNISYGFQLLPIRSERRWVAPNCQKPIENTSEIEI